MLEIGSVVPEVALEDSAGQAVSLAGADVLLYFVRSTSCPVCNSHVKDLAGWAGELAAAGVRVLVAFPRGGWRPRLGG